MRWERGHQSPDLIDRRGQSAGQGGLGLAWLLISLLRSRFGWIGMLIGIGVLLALGGTGLLGGDGAGTRAPQGVVQSETVQFIGFVLDDVQSVWTSVFAQQGKTYRRAKLVLFEDRTNTACGMGAAATGPFYCPSDERAYIDTSFFDELSRRFGASGDFAQAYVLAHEIGHHVQNLLGISDRVHDAPRNLLSGPQGLSVRLELQADCLAGVWAHSTSQRNLLEAGDVQEALGAASAVGDDRLQRRSRGTVSPESFTHGTSEQRARWFQTGLQQGRMEACDTFAASAL